MAKKQQRTGLEELFKKTAPEGFQEQPADPVKSFGIGLRVSEWEHLEQIAEQLGETRHAVCLWALRDFMRRFEAGEIPVQTKKTLPGL
jgi:hypothetical protein